MRLYCKNKFAINIAHNLEQNVKPKYVEVDIHFIKGNWIVGLNLAQYMCPLKVD